MAEESLDELLGKYWDLAYAEGKEGREHDTPEGDASKALYEIKFAIAEVIEQAHMAGQAEAGIEPFYRKAQEYRKSRL